MFVNIFKISTCFFQKESLLFSKKSRQIKKKFPPDFNKFTKNFLIHSLPDDLKISSFSLIFSLIKRCFIKWKNEVSSLLN